MERGSPEIEVHHSNFGRTILTLLTSLLLLLSLACSAFLYRKTQVLEVKYEALVEELSSQEESCNRLSSDLEQLRKAQKTDSDRISGAQKLIIKNTEYIRDLSRVNKSIYHIQSYHNGPVYVCEICKSIFDNGETWNIK